MLIAVVVESSIHIYMFVIFVLINNCFTIFAP